MIYQHGEGLTIVKLELFEQMDLPVLFANGKIVREIECPNGYKQTIEIILAKGHGDLKFEIREGSISFVIFWQTDLPILFANGKIELGMQCPSGNKQNIQLTLNKRGA